jgi:hypothetical protein
MEKEKKEKKAHCTSMNLTRRFWLIAFLQNLSVLNQVPLNARFPPSLLQFQLLQLLVNQNCNNDRGGA